MVQPHSMLAAIRQPLRPPGATLLWIAGTTLLLGLYAFVFTETAGEPISAALIDATANVLPLSLLAAAIHSLLRSHVMSLHVLAQIGSHALLAVIFATTWYAVVLVMLAFFSGIAGRGFAVSGFAGPAFTWQVFQGLILYAAIAATCYAIRGGRQAAELTIVTTPPLERYLTRLGEEMVPINVRDIATIIGAQDYSEVTTVMGNRHLVRMSLGEFERRLDARRFLRVHRSIIVNFDHLHKTESAGGGRLLAHMETGDIVQTSRAGAQLLRQFVV
jgi:two-component system, LytTR family, response regulator